MSLTAELYHDVIIFRVESEEDVVVTNFLKGKFEQALINKSQKTLVVLFDSTKEAEDTYNGLLKLNTTYEKGDE